MIKGEINHTVTAGFAKLSVQRDCRIMERQSAKQPSPVACGLLVGGPQRLRGVAER